MTPNSALNDPKEAGTALLKQGRFDEAAAVLREAVAMDADDEQAWRLLGGALASKGDAPGAIQAFQNSVRIAPMAARGHYNLGLAYQSASRLAEAKASLEKALALDPGYEQARLRLGEVARQLGGNTTAPAAPQTHTNIGGGDATGLGSIGSVYSQQQSQSAAPQTHTNIGGGVTTGLMSIGGHRETSPDAPAQGHTNIGGGNTAALGTIGAAASAPQETGHTNIGGGNAGMLGSVGTPGSAPGMAPPSPATGPVAPPPSVTPRLAPPTSVTPSNTGFNAPYAPTPVLGQNYGRDIGNTSGMKGDVPPEANAPFNWGAFWFGWIWMYNMRMGPQATGLLIFGIVSNSISRNLDNSAVSGLLGVLQLGIGIYLGINGNKLAWQNRTFSSVEDFHQCQRIWAYWALGMFILCLVLVILAIVVLGAAIFAAASGGGGGSIRR